MSQNGKHMLSNKLLFFTFRSRFLSCIIVPFHAVMDALADPVSMLIEFGVGSRFLYFLDKVEGLPADDGRVMVFPDLKHSETGLESSNRLFNTMFKPYSPSHS